MEFADIAASLAEKATLFYGKRIKNRLFEPEEKDIRIGGPRFYSGFASKELRPENVNSRKYYMAGFKMNNVVTGVNDYQTVSAMWLDCGGDGIILVSLDAIGLTGHDVNRIRDSLSFFSAASGCRYISISCSHTHAGIDTVGYWGKLPKTGKDTDFMNTVFNGIKEVCEKAYKNRKSGRLFSGSVRVGECVCDGRYPFVADDRLLRLRFVPDDESSETWFLNYGAHPNSLGGDNTLISADYPFYIRETINAEVRTNVMFSVGAIASVSIPKADDNMKNCKNAGRILGKAALGISAETELSPDIELVYERFPAPVDNSVLPLMPLLKVCTSDTVFSAESKTGIALITELTYIKIGTQKILVLPGEIFCELVYGGYADSENSARGLGAEINPTELYKICSDENLAIFGVSNDMTGYIVPPNDWLLHPTQAYLNSAKDRFGRNHYNETNSLGKDTADVIAFYFRKAYEKSLEP